jgi:putative transposase
MKKRQYTADEKLSVVLEMMKGNKPVSQICKEHGINDSLAYKWRDEALEGMRLGLSDKRAMRQPSADAEKERLLKIIGQQTVIIDFQKKIAQELSL